MPERSGSKVLLCGMDFGSTTSSFMLAQARIGQNFIAGQRAFEEPKILHRSEPIFTPFSGDRIDEAKIAAVIDDWLQVSGLRPPDIFAGGAIVTGLAAQRANASALVKIVRLRMGQAMMATADDPCLESWLAFMGSTAALSRAHPDRVFVNLDIGGGTTNPAYGQGGNVLAAGCHFIGARHFQLVPGSYRLTAISPFGVALLEELKIDRRVGDELSGDALERVLDYYVAGLEAIVRGNMDFFATPAGVLHQRVAFAISPSSVPEITFTGGVGELLYRLRAGQTMPGTTAFGDLGIDLAHRIAASRFLSHSLDKFVPEAMGRATVYGITLHSTEVSGASLYLPRPETLPLYDLPVIARLAANAPQAEFHAAMALAARASRGACVQICASDFNPANIRMLGARLASALEQTAYPRDRPLVVLVERNIGKVLGHYATDWGRTWRNLIIIDEVAVREAQFVNIGILRDGMVPISYFGMH